MQITNSMNINRNNYTSFGHKLPSKLNWSEHYATLKDKHYGTLEECVERYLQLNFRNDIEGAEKYLQALKDFKNARLDLTDLRNEYLPMFKKYGAEDQLHAIFNKFDAPLQPDGNKDISKIEVSIPEEEPYKGYFFALPSTFFISGYRNEGGCLPGMNKWPFFFLGSVDGPKKLSNLIDRSVRSVVKDDCNRKLEVLEKAEQARKNTEADAKLKNLMNNHKDLF